MHETIGTEQNHISKKKQFYSISKVLRKYLKHYAREIEIRIQYNDLLHFNYSFALIDNKGKDTLWQTVLYNEQDRQEINNGLTAIYAELKAAGNSSSMRHLYVDRIDYCTFGNSNPFRIKIVNKYNDNYDYFYIKTADASRIYGLELEHILAPNRINYYTNANTLIEEHIAGIPGDQFIKNNINDAYANQTRIAKEFVKFNERCFVKLLGDMRAYNFVIDITPDFEDVQYRIRAIDFDQQCYEGRKNLYLPQYFKENLPFVQLCMKYINPETVRQYQHEERSLIAHRLQASRHRIKDLLDMMSIDTLSMDEKVLSLKEELSEYYKNSRFLRCQSMGEIVKNSLWTVMRH